MSVNDAAQASKHGEFHASTGASEPLMKGGHQPGKLVGNDAVPEFNMKVLPAGSAPAGSTYSPNPDVNSQRTSQNASTTRGGATSGNVHTDQGQSSQQQHGAGKNAQFANQRSSEEDVPGARRRNVGGSTAQERLAEGAESVVGKENLSWVYDQANNPAAIVIGIVCMVFLWYFVL